MFVPQWTIERKRDGEALSEAEIRAFVKGIADGSLPDYQITAWAMAIYFRGMNTEETAILTDAMMHSGETLDFSDAPRPTADKHSTGGIGDKISFILAPLAAAAGLCVPMIAGRGLGITGGTIDKLEAIPGFNTALPSDEFKRIVCETGCCIIGQTARLAPADRRLYALRDVTGTVPSIPLLTASIMSKKLAEGAQNLVFDVKCGSGAFMKDEAGARALAQSLVQTGQALGRNCAALITDMNQPLGRTVGNALEVEECLELLRGGGPADIRAITLALTSRMLALAGLDSSPRRLEALLDGGQAWEQFLKMVTAQGGDARAFEKPGGLPQGACSVVVAAPRDGFVAGVDAETIGRVALQLGAGRLKTEDEIDLGAGICRLVQQGETVEAGAPLMELRCRDEARAQALAATAAAAVTLTETAPPLRRLFLDKEEPHGSAD